jgi:hypothetical protein
MTGQTKRSLALPFVALMLAAQCSVFVRAQGDSPSSSTAREGPRQIEIRCTANPDLVSEGDRPTIAAQASSRDSRIVLYKFRLWNQAQPAMESHDPSISLDTRKMYTLIGENKILCEAVDDRGRTAQASTTLTVIIGDVEEYKRVVMLDKLYGELYRKIYRSYDDAAKREVAQQTKFLSEYINDNCNPVERCRLGESKLEDINYFINKLLLEAQHDEERDVLLATSTSLGGFVRGYGEPPAPIQRFRKLRSPVVGEHIPNEPWLIRQYASYRRRISNTQIDREANEIDLGWSKKFNGFRTEIIGNWPMLDNDALTQINNSDSDDPHWRDLVDPESSNMSSFRIAPRYLPLDPVRGTYRFAPAYDVADGYSIAEQAEKSADSGLLFDCFKRKRDEESDSTPEQPESTCSFLVSTRTGHTSNYQIWLCSVTGDVQDGPPSDCAAYVVETSGETWIAVMHTITREEEGDGEALNEFPVGPDLSLTIYSRDPKFEALQLFARTLQLPPAALQVHLSSHSLRATSAQRYSTVLSTKYDKWHEWITIQIVEESCEGIEHPPAQWALLSPFCLEVTSTLLVNKQKDSDRSSWHPAPQYLSDRWLEQVRNTLFGGLHEFCKKEDAIGDVIACINTP